MSSPFDKNVPVAQPTYCVEDGVLDSARPMYNWMAIRAAGPNVLKDTYLCGDTTIVNPIFPNGLPPPDILMPQAFYQSFLLQNGFQIIFDAAPANQWIEVGAGAFNTRNWTIKWQYSQTNQLYNIFDNVIFQGVSPGSISVTNVSGQDITARLTLTMSVEAQTITGTPTVQVGIWQSEESGAPVASITPQSHIARQDGDLLNFTVDYIVIMKPGPLNIARPVIRYVGGNITTFSVFECNLVAEFIEFYDNQGGNDVLPGGQLPPPPPPV